MINNAPPTAGPGIYAFSLFNGLQKFGNLSVEMAYTFDFPLNEKKVKGNIMILSKIPSSTINRILNFFINPLRIPRKYDIYHILTQTLGRFALFVHPSIITINDISPLRFGLTEPTMYGDSTILPYGNRLVSAAFHTFVRKSIKSARYADVIISPSHFTKKELISVLKINPKKIYVIPHGLKHELFKPRDKIKARKSLGLPLNKKIVLHIGAENPRKNIPSLINAFYKLKKRVNSKIILVRVGETRKSTQRLIKSLSLSSSILQFGLLSERELSYIYNAADMFVFPSTYEGFGFPPLEAMASGCPVIAGNRTSLPEVLGDACILCDPLDIDALADEMEKLLKEEELRHSLYQKGLRRASRFSWKKVAEKTVKIYNRSSIKNILS